MRGQDATARRLGSPPEVGSLRDAWTAGGAILRRRPTRVALRLRPRRRCPRSRGVASRRQLQRSSKGAHRSRRRWIGTRSWCLHRAGDAPVCWVFPPRPWTKRIASRQTRSWVQCRRPGGGAPDVGTPIQLVAPWGGFGGGRVTCGSTRIHDDPACGKWTTACQQAHVDGRRIREIIPQMVQQLPVRLAVEHDEPVSQLERLPRTHRDRSLLGGRNHDGASAST